MYNYVCKSFINLCMLQPLDDLHPPLLSGKELVLMYLKAMFLLYG